MLHPTEDGTIVDPDLPEPWNRLRRTGPVPPNAHPVLGPCPVCAHDTTAERLVHSGARPKILAKLDLSQHLTPVPAPDNPPDSKSESRSLGVDGRAVVEIPGYGYVTEDALRDLLPDAVISLILTKGTDITTIVNVGRRRNRQQSNGFSVGAVRCRDARTVNASNGITSTSGPRTPPPP